MWTITCPTCGKILNQPEDAGDRPFQCPACGVVLEPFERVAEPGADHRINRPIQLINSIPDKKIARTFRRLAKREAKVIGKRRVELRRTSFPLETPFAWCFIGASLLTIGIGWINESPFPFLMCGLSGCLFLVLLRFLDWKKSWTRPSLAAWIYTPEEPAQNTIGGSMCHPTETGSERIRKT